jgi:two-component system, cell cycle sensor histidine kinase and response regulator CckA
MSTLKILLVEDNTDLAQLIAHMLRQGEAQIVNSICLSRLDQSLARLQTRDIDAVILDLGLPDSTGLQSLRAIRLHSPELAIVVLTANEDENTALQALREGAQDYLLKSEISANMLVRTIRFAIERKRGEQAHARLAAIVEGSRDAIIGMDLDGAVVSWNPAAERMFGYKLDEVAGRSLSMLVPADAPDEMPVILQWLQRGDPIKDFETVRRARDGRLVHIGVSISPVKSASGRIVGAAIIARDVEERIRGERERDTLLRQLQASVAQVELLSGLLPICASCKKVRDDQGYWTQVEVYVQHRTQAEFTHGICPECSQKYRDAIVQKL